MHTVTRQEGEHSSCPKHLNIRCLLLLILLGPMSMAVAVSESQTEESALANYQIMFAGNSHSAANDLPGLVAKMIRQRDPTASVTTGLAPGFRFLVDRLNDGETQAMLMGQPWTHVILQAQKYSTSGLYFYPTDAAEEWIRRVRDRNAQPILFPEWPRRGNTEEGQRVHDLHLQIASREPACVAPVGLAWDRVLETHPSITLHAPDGNHSSLNGAVLTAYVLYQLITGEDAAMLQNNPALGISAGIQETLRQAATEVVKEQFSACTESAAVGGGNGAFAGDNEVGIPAMTGWGSLATVFFMAVTGLGAAVRRTAP